MKENEDKLCIRRKKRVSKKRGRKELRERKKLGKREKDNWRKLRVRVRKKKSSYKMNE